MCFWALNWLAVGRISHAALSPPAQNQSSPLSQITQSASIVESRAWLFSYAAPEDERTSKRSRTRPCTESTSGRERHTTNYRSPRSERLRSCYRGSRSHPADAAFQRFHNVATSDPLKPATLKTAYGAQAKLCVARNSDLRLHARGPRTHASRGELGRPPDPISPGTGARRGASRPLRPG